jgi:hypothetical protein
MINHLSYQLMPPIRLFYMYFHNLGVILYMLSISMISKTIEDYYMNYTNNFDYYYFVIFRKAIMYQRLLVPNDHS